MSRNPGILPRETRLSMIPAFIKGYIKAYGHPPSCQEVADGFNTSKPTACVDIRILVEEGTLEREDGRHRTIRLAPHVRVRAMALGRT